MPNTYSSSTGMQMGQVDFTYVAGVVCLYLLCVPLGTDLNGNDMVVAHLPMNR